MSHDDVFNEIMLGASENQGNGVYVGFTSGSIYRNTPRFHLDCFHLRLTSYTDEIQVSNVLTSHSRKYKLCCVYFSVGNLREHNQKPLKSIHIVLVCKWSLVKKYGCGVVFKHVC